MNCSPKRILQVIAVMAVMALWFLIVFVLSRLITYTELAEMFLLTLCSLLLVYLGVILAREVNKLSDLRHWQRTQRRLRELKLWKYKQEQLLLNPRHKRSPRSW